MNIPGRQRWDDQVSGLSLAVARVAFGAVVTIVAIRYVVYGWVDRLLVDPAVHFSYPGFGWVEPWPQPFMTLHVVTIAIGGLAIAIGFRHRIAAGAVAVLFAYVELIDRTLYINHYYWIVLTAALFVFLPAGNRWSVDAALSSPRNVPLLAVWALRFQVGLVYVFAGLAKLNHDWLISGEPLTTWLGARTDVPLIGAVFINGAVPIALSWVGALFDLTIVGWLSWSRTRPYAYGALVAFHVTTWLLFPSIGVFPLVMAASATIFFAPDWPSHLVHGTRSSSRTAVSTIGTSGRSIGSGWLAPAALALYASIMIALPVSSHVGGQTLWSGDGYQFGWRVMLTEKAATADFRVVHRSTGDEWVVDGPTGLTPRQAGVMATDPALVVTAARLIEEEYAARGIHDVAVFGDVWMAYNGRVHRRFIDPTVDLTAPDRPSLTALVLPLEQ